MIQMCSQNNYSNITNFECYLNILLDLTKLQGQFKFGEVLSFQLLDVTVRVKSIRQYSVEQMQIILLNIEKLTEIFTKNGAISGTLCKLLVNLLMFYSSEVCCLDLWRVQQLRYRIHGIV